MVFGHFQFGECSAITPTLTGSVYIFDVYERERKTAGERKREKVEELSVQATHHRSISGLIKQT